MNKGTILITSPSLDARHNVSGISSVSNFIINNNSRYNYEHFELGRKDNEKRGIMWAFKMAQTTMKWISVVSSGRIFLIHFNFAFSRPSVLRDIPLIMYAKLIRKKMIIHVHGGEYLLKKQMPAWMGFFLNRIFTSKTPVLVLSPLEKNVLSKAFQIDTVKVLPNCVDLKEAELVDRQYEPKADLNLLFLGRIHADKGLEFIYQALTLLKNKGTSFKFYMAGTGPQEKEYVEKFSSLLASDFTYCGIVSGNAKYSLLTNCDVFLLPSLYEGLPMALLESMSFGMVPVVTDIGSISTVVKNGENGIILGKNPAEEMALAIEDLGRNSALLKILSANSKKFIVTHFDPEKYIVYLNEIYDIA